MHRTGRNAPMIKILILLALVMLAFCAADDDHDDPDCPA